MKKSKLEIKFKKMWDDLFPTTELEEELALIPKRRFRFDFVHIETKTVIEINGGTWIQGRHNRGSHMKNEYTKLNLALAEGYHVFLLTGNMIDKDNLNLIKNYIENQLKREDFYVNN